MWQIGALTLEKFGPLENRRMAQLAQYKNKEVKSILKTILTTPTPHMSKKYDPKICHKMRGRMA